MKHRDIIPAWGRILQGRRPLLSLEITRECPLRCPGCYAYEPEHLHAAGPLRQLADFQGEELINRVLALVRRLRPLHISIVGGEPLVRYRELEVILPALNEMGIEVQLVTSAVRAIPPAWRDLPNLHLAVSIDGLQPEHDLRRAPATYDRILKHIAGHRLIAHCTVTRQQIRREGYLAEFAKFWSGREEIRKIWFSLFTPQQGVEYEERLTPADRAGAVNELERLRVDYPKVYAPDEVLQGYLHPPASPQECIFSQTTDCISADHSDCAVPVWRGAGVLGMRMHRVGGTGLHREVQDRWASSGVRNLHAFPAHWTATQRDVHYGEPAARRESQSARGLEPLGPKGREPDKECGGTKNGGGDRRERCGALQSKHKLGREFKIIAGAGFTRIVQDFLPGNFLFVVKHCCEGSILLHKNFPPPELKIPVPALSANGHALWAQKSRRLDWNREPECL